MNFPTGRRKDATTRLRTSEATTAVQAKRPQIKSARRLIRVFSASHGSEACDAWTPILFSTGRKNRNAFPGRMPATLIPLREILCRSMTGPASSREYFTPSTMTGSPRRQSSIFAKCRGEGKWERLRKLFGTQKPSRHMPRLAFHRDFFQGSFAGAAVGFGDVGFEEFGAIAAAAALVIAPEGFGHARCVR